MPVDVERLAEMRDDGLAQLSTFYYSNHAIGERLAAFLHRAIAGEDPAELREIVSAAFVDHQSQIRHD